MNWNLVLEIALGIVLGGFGVVLVLAGIGYLYSFYYERRAVRWIEARDAEIAERRAERDAARKAQVLQDPEKPAEETPKNRYEVLIDSSS